jgi:hypothetical protein
MIRDHTEKNINGVAAQQFPFSASMIAFRGEPHHSPETHCAQEVETAEVQYQRMVNMHEANKIIADLFRVAEVNIAAQLYDRCGRVGETTHAHAIAKSWCPRHQIRDFVVSGFRQQCPLPVAVHQR